MMLAAHSLFFRSVNFFKCCGLMRSTLITAQFTISGTGDNVVFDERPLKLKKAANKIKLSLRFIRKTKKSGKDVASNNSVVAPSTENSALNKGDPAEQTQSKTEMENQKEQSHTAIKLYTEIIQCYQNYKTMIETALNSEGSRLETRYRDCWDSMQDEIMRASMILTGQMAEMPDVQDASPAPEFEQPIFGVEAPPVAIVKLPVEAKASEGQTPTTEAKTPAVEVETPVVEAETPAVEAEVETPAVDAKAPAVEAESPAIEVETPAVEAETPAVEVETPAVEVKASAPEIEKSPVEIEIPAIDSTVTSEVSIVNQRAMVLLANMDSTSQEYEATKDQFVKFFSQNDIEIR